MSEYSLLGIVCLFIMVISFKGKKTWKLDKEDQFFLERILARQREYNVR